MILKFKVIITVVCVVAVGAPLSYLGIEHFAQQQVNSANLSITSIQVHQANLTSMEFTTNIEVQTTSGLSVSFGVANLKLAYQGIEVGKITPTTTSFSSSVHNFSTDCNLSVTDSTQYLHFLSDFVSKSDLSAVITGQIDFTGSLSSLGSQAINKTVSLRGLNGFDIAITNLSVYSIQTTNLTVGATITYNNPSSVSMNILDTFVTVEYKNVTVGSSVIRDLNFSNGAHSFELRVNLSATSLIHDFVYEKTLDFRFSAGVSFDGVSSIPILNSSYEANGMNGFNFTIDSYSIQTIQGQSMGVQVVGTYYNPSGVTMRNAQVHFVIGYENAIIGNASLQNLNFSTGLQSLDFVANISAPSLINDFIQDQMLNMSVAVAISSDNFSWSPLLNTSFEFNGLDGLTPQIYSIDLIDANSTALVFNLTSGFNNPSDVDVNITNLSVNISYEGKLVGNASMHSLRLNPGENNLTLKATLNGDNAAISDILANYINGNSTALGLNISADVKVSATSTLLPIDTITTVQIQGAEIPLVKVNDLKISVTLTMNWGGFSAAVVALVTITINNPMPFAITINNFVGSIYYNDSDGYSFSFGGFPYSNSSSAYISMGPLNLSKQGTGYPKTINGNKSLEDNLSIAPAITFDTGCRYYYDSPTAYMDVIDGSLSLGIGGFSTTVHNLSMRNIGVPVTVT